ncbi:beta-hydroxyacyl-ACP dehydratase [Puniceicoccales bacterium CK1056]|uniref:Beta-hydroxyacyl-ACP dehydratase n=1 Tax=Oceanipulchritudo coccoides TaxID=2706888 RepID=A0A6B2M3J5_9BACT|nr:3-hydroxyacyl-ACP dehydratase FabZ [Oceanipulchritudo coccoides]NDV62986.1 beta-hydroxyacyl-ACP dehydratase [Oceanipulchritudo coccoides]
MEEIYKTIPHRPPFLFVDRIIEVTEESAVAERDIREDEPHFQGHYPGNPLMPGVLLCESVFQTAAIYMMKRFSSEVGTEGSKTPVLARIQEAKFKQMVRPGDTIRIEATFKETLSKFHFMRGKVHVGGKLALTVDFALALLDA